MHTNTENIEKLADISNDVKEKIGVTAEAMDESNKVAIDSNNNSLIMSENIKEIIENIEKIEELSTKNGKSAISIESDLKRLVEVAASLQNTIDEFKS